VKVNYRLFFSRSGVIGCEKGEGGARNEAASLVPRSVILLKTRTFRIPDSL
jgi:hypothetical protein